MIDKPSAQLISGVNSGVVVIDSLFDLTRLVDPNTINQKVGDIVSPLYTDSSSMEELGIPISLK